jgi:hypothetical protein
MTEPPDDSTESDRRHDADRRRQISKAVDYVLEHDAELLKRLADS